MILDMKLVQEVAQKIANTPEVAFIPLLAFFSPIGGILGTVALVVFLDTMTGVWKGYKTSGWDGLTSRRFSSLLSKILLYNITVITTFAVDKYVIGELIFFSDVENLTTKVVSLVVIVIEAKSIDENYKEVTGTGLWQAFKSLISRTDEIRDDIKKMTKK